MNDELRLAAGGCERKVCDCIDPDGREMMWSAEISITWWSSEISKAFRPLSCLSSASGW